MRAKGFVASTRLFGTSTRWGRWVLAIPLVMLLIAGGLLCLALPGRAEAAVAPPYAYLQITNNSYPDGAPVVSQGRVAWIGEDKSGFGLMVYDSLTGVTKNVSPHASEYSNHPVLAGDLVAWSSNSGGENQIHAFGLTTGIERLVATPQDDNEELSTDGHYVAWYDRAAPGAPADIYLWDSSGGARKITNDPLDDYGPQVSDGYVVWMRESATDPANLVDVMLYDTRTGVTTRVTSEAERYRSIGIDAGRVFWQQGPWGSAVVGIYDIAKATTAIVTDASNKYFVSMGGNKVVWSDGNGPSSDVYVYDLVTRTTTRLSDNSVVDAFALTDGRLVAWWTASGTNTVNVYDCVTGHTTQFGTPGVPISSPQLDLGRVVWAAGQEATSEVYTVAFPMFDDVPAANVYFRAIQGLAERRLISGYTVSRGATEFRPANPVLRAQFAKMVSGALRLQPYETMALPPFTDLGPDDPNDLYPHEYIAAVYNAQITFGITPTKFSPFTTISRAQAVTMVYRGVQKLYPGLLATPPAGYLGSLGNFSAAHQKAMQALEFNGVLADVQGFGPKWSPWADASRADLAQILWAIMQKIANYQA